MIKPQTDFGNPPGAWAPNPQGKSSPHKELCDAFDRDTSDGANMGQYTALLAKAVEAIASQVEQTRKPVCRPGREASWTVDVAKSRQGL